MVTKTAILTGTSIVALDKEINLDIEAVKEMKNLLHAHWFQTPAITGHYKYASVALVGLKENPVLKNSFLRYKAQRTNEEGYSDAVSGFRAHKRLYLNSDELIPRTKINLSQTATTPWGSEYRIAGAAIYSMSSFGDMSNPFTINVGTLLLDYHKSGTHHTVKHNNIIDVRRINNIPDMPEGTNAWWDRLYSTDSSFAKINDSGRYLITARVNLTYGPRSANPDDIELSDYRFQTFYQIGGTGASYGTYSSLTNSGSLEDYTPSIRLALTQLRKVNGEFLIHKSYYSNEYRPNICGLLTYPVTIGFSRIIDFEKDDEFIFHIERTKSASMMRDAGGTTRVDTLLVNKVEYPDVFLPDRDKDNYVEITRLCGKITVPDSPPPPPPSGGPFPPPPPPVTPTTKTVQLKTDGNEGSYGTAVVEFKNNSIVIARVDFNHPSFTYPTVDKYYPGTVIKHGIYVDGFEHFDSNRRLNSFIPSTDGVGVGIIPGPFTQAQFNDTTKLLLKVTVYPVIKIGEYDFPFNKPETGAEHIKGINDNYTVISDERGVGIILDFGDFYFGKSSLPARYPLYKTVDSYYTGFVPSTTPAINLNDASTNQIKYQITAREIYNNFRINNEGAGFITNYISTDILESLSSSYSVPVFRLSLAGHYATDGRVKVTTIPASSSSKFQLIAGGHANIVTPPAP